VRPTLDRALEVCAATLMGDVAPHVAPSYRQASVLASGVVLTSVREELDRIASRRIEENACLRAIFREAAAVVADPALRARLADASSSTDGDFRISALDAANDSLRALLIELHAHVETLESQEARDLESRIWQELAASTERRRLSLGAF
jgi:hypothetical protein